MTQQINTSVEINIDPKLCVFCGLCEVFCPFKAIRTYIDDKPMNSILKNSVFPEVLREVKIDEETCMRVNLLCERLCTYVCPLDMIQFNGNCIRVKSTADCPACGWCQAVCRSVIKVTKALKGSIKINYERCPEGCKACFYVCPVGAICLDEEGRVRVLEEFCIFCGACKNNCPKEDAITISIIEVNTRGSSIWKDLAERLLLYTPARNKKSTQASETPWPKISVCNDHGRLRIERRTYLRRHILELDKSKCWGCRICYIVCPKAAISIKRITP